MSADQVTGGFGCVVRCWLKREEKRGEGSSDGDVAGHESGDDDDWIFR